MPKLKPAFRSAPSPFVEEYAPPPLVGGKYPEGSGNARHYLDLMEHCKELSYNKRDAEWITHRTIAHMEEDEGITRGDALEFAVGDFRDKARGKVRPSKSEIKVTGYTLGGDLVIASEEDVNALFDHPSEPAPAVDPYPDLVPQVTTCETSQVLVDRDLLVNLHKEVAGAYQALEFLLYQNSTEPPTTPAPRKRGRPRKDGT